MYEFVVLFLIRSEYCLVILVKQQSQSPRWCIISDFTVRAAALYSHLQQKENSALVQAFSAVVHLKQNV